MKERLLQYLVCPGCAQALALHAAEREGREIMSGELRCTGCAASYPIRSGIPRFADTGLSPDKEATAKNFGAEWLIWDQVKEYHDAQFRDWIAPVTPDFVRGRTVVEGGCGKGRHTRAIAEWGAHDIIGVDLSEAVEAAYRNTRDLENAHVIQADIYRLPLRSSFDYAFSVGVLHHLPDPRGGFNELVRHVKPGGAISAWVYGRENNGWIVHLINPLRNHFTSKLSPKTLYYLSALPSVFLFVLLKLVYAPLADTKLSRLLFYSDYLTYIARFPFWEVHSIVFDHLTAPTAFYISRAEFDEWFRAVEAQGVEIAWHNRNSWRGFGKINASAQTARGYS